MNSELVLSAARKAAGAFIRAHKGLDDREDIQQQAVLLALEAAGQVDWSRTPGEVVNWLATRTQWALLKAYRRTRETLMVDPDMLQLVRRAPGAAAAMEAAGQLAWSAPLVEEARAAEVKAARRHRRYLARKRAEGQRSRLTKRRSQGLCIQCGRPPEPTRVGRTRCGACVTKNKSKG